MKGRNRTRGQTSARNEAFASRKRAENAKAKLSLSVLSGSPACDGSLFFRWLAVDQRVALDCDDAEGRPPLCLPLSASASSTLSQLWGAPLLWALSRKRKLASCARSFLSFQSRSVRPTRERSEPPNPALVASGRRRSFGLRRPHPPASATLFGTRTTARVLCRKAGLPPPESALAQCATHGKRLKDTHAQVELEIRQERLLWRRRRPPLGQLPASQPVSQPVPSSARPQSPLAGWAARCRPSPIESALGARSTQPVTTTTFS